MSEAITEVATPETPDAEADLSAGFAKAQGDPPSTEAKKVEEPKADATTEAAKDQATTEQPKAEDHPAPGTLIAGKTEAEILALFEKVGEVDALKGEIRKGFGQYGEVKAALKELKETFATGTSARKAVTLKKLRAEFPDLADALESDLSEAETATATAQAEAKTAGSPFDPDAYFAEKVAPALKEAEARGSRNAELRILKYAHPDYQTVIYADPKTGTYTDDFKAWNVTQTADRQKAIQESEDAIEIAGFVTEFKAWKAAQAKAAKQKTTRLENAITPSGSGNAAPPDTEDADAQMAKGFKKAKGH